MWVVYTTGCYAAMKSKDIINFGGKLMELENIMMSEITDTQNNIHDKYLQISVSIN